MNQNGAEGFFKGAFSGVVGFIIKPITGVIDMTAKTAEGIKNDIQNIQQR